MRLVVAIVVAMVGTGTGAVAWARGDTDEPTPHASFQTIDLILFPIGNRSPHVNITPLYHDAKCVKHDATNPPGRTISQETVVTLGVTVLGTFATGCHIKRSQMFWRLDHQTTVTLIKPAGARVRAECVPSARCTRPRHNALRIGV